jgi:hypothetical protein
MMDNYISRLDEIDKWLFDSFGILPGACSSTENLRHITARMVAEALWPKKEHTPAFEFPFDVPDNDGYLVFTAMDNQTIRKALKLKKGEGIIVSIRKAK